ncbi:hypothetical protein KW535_13645 [Vibrio fluvialis]|nr:hypothetical protein [Vibrio fluvialis]
MLIRIVFDEVNLIFKMDDILMTLGTLATAICTWLAAKGAMKSAKLSKEHLEKQTEQFDLESFYKLLDSLERAHGIVFIQRNKLSEDIKDVSCMHTCYSRFVECVKVQLDAVKKRDVAMNLKNIPPENRGGDRYLYSTYVDFAREIGNLFHFNFIIDPNEDYVVTVSGAKIPLQKYDSTNFVFVSAVVAAEILSTKMKRDDVVESPERYSSALHLESFKAYCSEPYDNTGYKYVSA